MLRGMRHPARLQRILGTAPDGESLLDVHYGKLAGKSLAANGARLLAGAEAEAQV